MGKRLGSGLYATSLNVSKKDEEIVPKDKQFYSIEFVPETNCTLEVNGSFEIPVVGKVGIKTDHRDVVIFSLKIKEANIKYIFGGKY